VPKSSSRKNDVRRANRDRRARLDELRRRQRAAERRKNFLFIGSAIAVAVILIGSVIAIEVVKVHNRDAKSRVGYQAAPTKAEAAAGCLGVHNDPVSPRALHVANQPIDYTINKYGDTRGGTPPIPPSGGEHNPIPLGDQKTRFYPLSEQPRPERAVHDLEHGYIVVWYDGKLPAAQVDQLRTLTTGDQLNRMLVVGWWQGDLPAGKHVVLTSWGRTERCSSVSPDVISSFYAAHLNSPLAPEAGSGASSMGGDQFPPNDLNTTPVGSPTPTPSPSRSRKK
jgi:hypothetical protein